MHNFVINCVDACLRLSVFYQFMILEADDDSPSTYIALRELASPLELGVGEGPVCFCLLYSLLYTKICTYVHNTAYTVQYS